MLVATRRGGAGERAAQGRPQLTEALSCLAVTAPGIASLTARELRGIGIRPTAVHAEGVSFRAPVGGLYAANLWLRTASRVVVRAAEFRAETFYDLERRAARIPWSRYLPEGRAVRLRVSCRKSRLYHSDAVAERIARVVQGRGATMVAGGSDAPGAEVRGADGVADEAQLIVVRVYRDVCTVSVDASGALLHRRGYRQETAKAPMRETLAAALVLASAWDRQSPLCDPFCGSGTIAIEAAWMARKRAPGLGRPFSFMRWPQFDPTVWEALVSQARLRELEHAPARIQASDRDAGAAAAAGHNAARAGVAEDIDVSARPVSAIDPPPGAGWLVTNPPYGVRLGERQRLRNLYAQLGHVARAKCRGWVVALISADPVLARQTGLPMRVRLRTTNGGIPVEVLTAEVG